MGRTKLGDSGGKRSGKARAANVRSAALIRSVPHKYTPPGLTHPQTHRRAHKHTPKVSNPVSRHQAHHGDPRWDTSDRALGMPGPSTVYVCVGGGLIGLIGVLRVGCACCVSYPCVLSCSRRDMSANTSLQTFKCSS
jgi:hypothetical protein